jgi:hypothetical protein
MPKKVKAPEQVSDSLRAAILDSGQSLYRVSRDSQLSYPVVHGFVRGYRALSMRAMDRLCQYFNLRLTSEKGN